MDEDAIVLEEVRITRRDPGGHLDMALERQTRLWIRQTDTNGD